MNKKKLLLEVKMDICEDEINALMDVTFMFLNSNPASTLVDYLENVRGRLLDARKEIWHLRGLAKDVDDGREDSGRGFL